jgi:hypothetical protein
MDGIRDSSELKLNSKEFSKFQSVLEKLMSIDTLNVVAKALRLQRDGEHLYCTAKILSDIRPVFGSDPNARPLGAVLTHTLKVGYHKGSDHREFHIILDANDLEALEEVINRARAKDKTLREFLNAANLPSLDE